MVLPAAVPDVHRVLHLGVGRDQPVAVRPAGGRKRDRRRLLRRIQRDGVRAVLPGRIRQHDPDERDDPHPVPGRLAGTFRYPAAARTDLVHPEDLLLPFRVPMGTCHFPALSVRSADAAWLEGVPAVVTALADADCGGADAVRVAAQWDVTPTSPQP